MPPGDGQGRGDRVAMSAESQSDRHRITRLLTFWLRPVFVLRVLNRFQRMVGFDRAIALASSSLTALIPIAILVGSVLNRGDAHRLAEQIISRYGLTGAGAGAVRDVLSPASGTSTDISVTGVFLLLIAALSFSRGVQRMFEQAWDLKSLSVRNTINDVTWIAGLVAYVGFSWWIHSLLDHTRVQMARLAAAGAVRDPRVRAGRYLPDLRRHLSTSAVQLLRIAIRRDRRGAGNDLRTVHPDGRDRHVRGGRSRGVR
jgi:Virulence factor BrkB